MPRDHTINEERLSVLRGELARTRERYEQAVAERDDLALRLDKLLGLLVQRRALTERAALRLLGDMGQMFP